VSPGGHLVTTAVACAAVQMSTGSVALTAGVAAGGFLIDLDHVLDYVLFERQRDLRPAAFLRYYLAGNPRLVVLLLHSYELLAALALAAWWTNLEGLWGYVLGAAALHLPLDIVFNGKVTGRNMVPFYSSVYRTRAGFRTSRLLDAGRIGAPDPRFWSAFFVGSVVSSRSARASSIASLASPSAAARPSLAPLGPARSHRSPRLRLRLAPPSLRSGQLDRIARLAFGCGSPYITGPMIQGANSSSPTPLSSLLDRFPDATATISSKI
jgi:hypothetical protein